MLRTQLHHPGPVGVALKELSSLSQERRQRNAGEFVGVPPLRAHPFLTFLGGESS